MRFRTRTFLLSFVPFALLLAGSFWAIQSLVQSTVRDGVRNSLRDNHLAVGRLHARSELQNSRFLKIAGENAELKAGLQLANASPSNPAVRLTVEEQITDLCDRMGFDVLMLRDAYGRPLAGVVRNEKALQRMTAEQFPAQAANGLATISGATYHLASVPIDQADENLGSLMLGEKFDLAEFSAPALLLLDGQLIESNLKNISQAEITTRIRACRQLEECEIRLGGETYVSVAMEGISLGNGYALRTLQSIDAASGAVRLVLERVFAAALVIALLVALVCGIVSAQSIVGPISSIVTKLRASAVSGKPVEFTSVDTTGSISEIRELMEAFNREAASVREGRERLGAAYVQFIGTLAHAIDARDQYTSGHSSRVSELACALARELGLEREMQERVRVGALLHDIGKIGISDAVLQKPGKLTVEEFEIIKQHPTIGRRILEGVSGFEQYLGSVELHHENWDGSGYPKGLSGEAVPLAARIIHVADAYDAMTSDRPYRRGMTHTKAMQILAECAGTQFDPRLVAVFQRIAALSGGSDTAGDLLRLLTAVQDEKAKEVELT